LLRLAKGGDISIEIDGKEAAKGKAHMLFAAPLSNSVRTGEDVEGDDKIGSYEGRFGFVGNFQKASLELNKPSEGGNAETASAPKATIQLPAHPMR
jgi:hypothetical protein